MKDGVPRRGKVLIDKGKGGAVHFNRDTKFPAKGLDKGGFPGTHLSGEGNNSMLPSLFKESSGSTVELLQ